MPEVTIQQTFEAAIGHHRAGRLAEAERLYRQILSQQPGHADALHLLGVIAQQVGQYDVAVELIGRAVAVQPTYAEAHSNLGNALKEKGRLDEAIAAYRRAIALKPEHAASYNNLGVALSAKGRFDEAIAACRQALALQPGFAEACNNLANALLSVKRLDEAIAAYRQTVALKPEYVEGHSNLGMALREKGQMAEAIAAFRRAVALNPKYAVAWFNLGNLLEGQGQLDESMAAYRQAIALRPDDAAAYSNLGLVLQRKGQFEEAIAASRKAIALRPDLAEAHSNLGNALKESERLDEAVASYQRALAFNPRSAATHLNLGAALTQKGEVDAAIAACRQAVALDPNHPEAYNNLGGALKDKGQLEEAIAAYGRAIALKPEFAEAYSNLAVALRDSGRLDEALAACRKAIAINPRYGAAHLHLGAVLSDKGDAEAAIGAYQEALALKPRYPEAYLNLGGVLKDVGRLDEAIAAYRQVLALKPDSPGAHSNLIYTMSYHPGYDSRAIAEELRRWNQQHAEPLKKFIRPHDNERDPERRLRIGYVSADFCSHASAFFFVPLLEHHDAEQVEIFCYAQVARPDATTRRLRERAQQWRSTVGVPDAEVARQIREDKIDILVDLKVHTAHHRLLVFARKPAPVQATWLGYPGSTGLSTVDYRLSDPHLDPPGTDESVYSEQTMRLPETFWCFDPLDGRDIPVNDLPAIANGHITFGCLNNFCKVNEPVLRQWGKVMQGVPSSRLLMMAPEGSHRQGILKVLESEGVAAERIEFITRQPRRRYLEQFQRIDIGLDPFPCNGHTTSLDSFWMGVPVITMVGETIFGRAGVSQLANLGLREFAATTAEEYTAVAVRLAGDVARLQELRGALRQRMEQSALMDGARFARNMEAAYREMWKKWCATCPK